MAKPDSMQRRKERLVRLTRERYRESGLPEPANGVLDWILASWRRSRWTPLREPWDIAKMIGAQQEGLQAAIRAEVAAFDRDRDGWLARTAAKHGTTVDELVAAFDRHKARWADPTPAMPDSWAFVERAAHIAVTDPALFAQVGQSERVP